MNFKLLFLPIAAGVAAFSLAGAEFSISAGKLKGELDTLGGSLKSLKFDGKDVTSRQEKTRSFTERVFFADGKRQVLEDFAKLEFKPIAVGKDFVTFSALGVKAFDWLRITKTYRIDAAKDLLTVTWKLENRSDKAREVGFWNKSFLRRDNGMGMINRYFLPRGGKLAEVLHPGGGSDDEWTLEPSGAFAAVAGKDDNTGAVVLPPPELLTTLYSWFSRTKDEGTLEWFLREQTVPAGGVKEFSVRVKLSENIPAELNKPEYAARKLVSSPGKAPLLPLLYSGKDKTIVPVWAPDGVMKKSVQVLDIRGKRQYCDSVRGVRIPGNIDASMISVFDLANHSAEYDRPVPFKIEKLPSGEQRILVHVRGINPEGYYYTKFQDGFSYDSRRKDQFLGADSFAYRICFDRPAATGSDPELFAAGADLVHNGTFDKKGSFGEWPDGYFWSNAVRSRGLYHWVKEGRDGSMCMKIVRPKGNKFYAVLPVFFRPEPGVKYTASAKVKCDNGDREWATGVVNFMDAANKEMRKQSVNLFHDKNAYDWTERSKEFYTPEGAVCGAFRFAVWTPNQTMWVDDVKIVPEDFRYVARSRTEILREELKGSRYKFLDLLEQLSPAVITPHVKWLDNPVDPMPEILYMPLGTTRSVQNTERRQILEFAQRMKFSFQYIPLLRKVESAGSWDVAYGNSLEKYTMHRIESIKKAPAVIIVQAIDFKTEVQKEFVDLLRKFQLDGSNFFFYNCKNVPELLLGKKVPVPEGVFATPKFRSVSQGWLDRACSAYVNGNSKVICFTRNASEWYLEAYLFECVPPEVAQEKCPAYHSCEFPYWEYIYLSALKSLRHLAGVEPEVRVLGNLDSAAGIRVRAKRGLDATLKVVYRDLNRGVDAETSEKVSLKAGENQVNFPLPALPGGTHVADYWLTASDGKVYDCGALRFDTPDLFPMSVKFTDADKVFERGKEVSAEVTIPKVPAGAELEYSVEDTNGRMVAAGKMKAAVSRKLSFRILPPYTTLYRLRLKLVAGNRVESRIMEQFSMPSAGKDLTQLDAFIWLSRTPMLKTAADLGFTMWIVNFFQNGESMGRFRAVRNVDLEPVTFGAGHANYTTSLKYRHDIPSDPVRTPCFSDPEHWKKAEDYITGVVKNQKYRYYGIKHHEIADEAYLGSTVCFSPHCLADFRKVLKEQYGTLEALNKGWATSFKSWDEVTPVQLKEIRDKDNLSPWLDHKMFMAGVFARQWVGNTGNILRKMIPGSKVGLSGTQIPGYSYDWAQLMKYIDCLSYYGGIQRKAVHDFAVPGFVSGMWGGGYAPPETENEFYQKSNIWDDLFLGANMVSNFAGHSFNGDLTPVKNTVHYADLVRELRRGPARLVLSSKEVRRDIAVLYSQPSLFAAMGGIGGSIWHNSQTGWAALLADLKYSYYFITYESLDREVPKAKVLILPATLALSQAAVKNLETYVANGGTLIADFAPGWYDRHGKRSRNAELEKLFGVSRDKALLSAASSGVKSSGMAKEGIPALEGEFQIGEKALAAAGAGNAAVSADGTPVFFVNRVGKGRAILLNTLLSGYQDIGLGGVGGELLAVKSGAALFCDNMRKLLGGVLETAGARHNSTITDAATGELYPCNSTLRRDGENYVFGMLKTATAAPDGKSPMRFDAKFARKLNVKLPVEGFIYDVRKGVFLGKTDHFSVSLIPGDGQLFSVLKSKVEKVTVVVPASVERGKELTVKFRAVGGSGAHVFRMELTAPDGRTVPVYTRDGRFDDAKGEMTFQTALNDLPGKWNCTVTDVNTGISGSSSFTLR